MGNSSAAITALPSGTTLGSRTEATSAATAADTVISEGTLLRRGVLGSSSSGPRSRRTKCPLFGRTSTRPSFSSSK